MEDKKDLKMITCFAPGCGFGIQSYDDEEILEATKKHAERFHATKITDEEVLSEVQKV